MLYNWRINNGYLCAGTLRIARMDYDTNPSESYKKEFEMFIVNRLNQADQQDNQKMMDIDKAVLTICNLSMCAEAPDYFKEAATVVKEYVKSTIDKQAEQRRNDDDYRLALRLVDRWSFAWSMSTGPHPTFKDWLLERLNKDKQAEQQDNQKSSDVCKCCTGDGIGANENGWAKCSNCGGTGKAKGDRESIKEKFTKWISEQQSIPAEIGEAINRDFWSLV